MDDRSLNRRVLDELRKHVLELGVTSPTIVEIGAGIGAMVARLADWSIVSRARYVLVDADAESRRESAAFLEEWATSKRHTVRTEPQGVRITAEGGVDLDVRFAVWDVTEPLGTPVCDAPAHVVMASAFLDLVDVPSTLPRLFELVGPDGLYWFSVNFDGETVFLPEDPADSSLMRAYHRSMDERVREGRAAGDSKTGRHLFPRIVQAGASVLAAGSSDWVVHADPSGAYEAREADFLRHIVGTVEHELSRHPGEDPRDVAAWARRRRTQIENGELVYIAHQLDFMGRCHARPGAPSAQGDD